MDPGANAHEPPNVMPNARPEGFPQQRPLMPIHNDGTEKEGPGFAKMAPKVDPAMLPHEQCVIDCDAVVISGGRKAVDAEAFRDIAPEFYVIGDNVAPYNIKFCTQSAFVAAMNL